MPENNNIIKMLALTDLFKPIILALISLGGSGTIEEIDEKVFEIENFSYYFFKCSYFIILHIIANVIEIIIFMLS